MSEKIYCGSAKVITTQYGDLTKISFHKDDINKIVAYMNGESSDWINLVVKEKREKVEGKPTHYLEVDEWKPANNNTPIANNGQGSPVDATPIAEDANPNDLPF